MFRPSVIALLSLFVCTSSLQAQSPARARVGDEEYSLSAPLIAVVASKERVLFTTIALTREIQLEVLSSTGAPLYDSGRQPGNRLEWPIIDQQGMGLRDGLYGCLVTVTDLFGHMSHRRAVLRVKEGEV